MGKKKNKKNAAERQSGEASGGSAPPSGGSAPPGGGSAPPGRGSAPPSGGSAPPGRGSAPPGGGSAPPGGGSAPPGRGSAPPGGGSAPPGGGSAPPGRGSAPPGGGSAPPSGGSAPPSGGSAPAWGGFGRGDGGSRGRGDGGSRGRGDGSYRGRGDGGFRGRSDGGSRGRGDGGSRGRGNEGGAMGRGGEGRGAWGRGRGGDGRGRGGTAGRGSAYERGSPRESESSDFAPLPSVSPVQKFPTPPPQQMVTSPQKRPIPPELTPAEAALKKLSIKVQSSKFQPPIRKSVGTRGVKFPVETNHVSLHIAVKEIIHYDVNIEPDKPKKFMRYVMEQVRRECYSSRYPAFDGRKNLYSSGPLFPNNELVHEITFRDQERNMDLQYKVTIKFAARVDTSSLERYINNGTSIEIPQRAIQAIDIVLRSAQSLRFTPVGRSYFTRPRDQIIDLGDGLELWYGFYQSAILGWKPFLNVDVAHKGFPKAQSCLDLVMEFCGDLNNPDYNGMAKLASYIKGLKVNYAIPNVANSRRTYKVNSLTQEAANRTMFDHEGQQMSVAQYYAQVKGYRIQYPHLPCLHLGSPTKQMKMPLELCAVAPGQVIMRKLNENQTTKMIRAAAKPADERKNKIMDTLRAVNFSQDPTLKEFGIVVGQSFERVPARKLDAPNIKNTVVSKGVWNTRRFSNGMELTSWVIANLDYRTRPEKISDFVSQMIRTGNDLGMRIAPPTSTENVNTRNRNWEDIFQKYAKANPPITIVIVIIPDLKGVYEKVKQASELRYGILTQCIKGSTIFRMKPATVGNILLKVNSKLNGTNHEIENRLSCFRRPIMIVGADVTHPSPDAESIPSAAAVAASFDVNAFQYAIQYRLQPPRVEIIEDLENIMREHLLMFYKRNRQVKPEKIIMFRDGVSDGQFAMVLNEELSAIRRACQKMENGYNPQITFLVVQKRHHTRFFPPPNFADGKNKNVPAGTIVDSEITHPTEHDFYLVSHASIQGTSRPTKYHLLWDDSDFSTDDLQTLTYHLCHMFSRCNRSVSYPAPTYNAHLAAFRARVYIDDGRRLNMQDLAREQSTRKITDRIVNNSPMFFV